jgi:quercetin dioxygenase-like cupin family protein
MTHHHDSDNGSPLVQSRVMEYALGRLSPEEERAFVSQLEASSEMQAELTEIMDSLSQIAEAYTQTMPSPRRSLKDQVMQFALGNESHEHSTFESEKVIVRSAYDDNGWTESGMPGITIKPLYSNSVLGTQTALVRLAPGTHYPKHRHVGTEECLVMEGVLRMDDITLTAGDFVVNKDGEIHHDTWTDEGCLLLLSGSLHDEYDV